MGIVNRSLDVSEQRKPQTQLIHRDAGAGTHQFWVAPYACEIEAARLSAVGVSGAMVARLVVQRFVEGAGDTTIPIPGTTITVTAVGTSGVQDFGLDSASLPQLTENDRLAIVLATGDNIVSTAVEFVAKVLSDINKPLSL